MLVPAAFSWPMFGAAVAAVVALLALIFTRWTEGQRLFSQHRAEQRKELRRLIGRYHGRLLEAAIDWDRRMHQLYESRGEREERSSENPYEEHQWAEHASRLSAQEEFLDDPDYRDDGPVEARFGKYGSPKEYLFRSYIYRFVALCRLARRFETAAYYIDSKVGRRK